MTLDEIVKAFAFDCKIYYPFLRRLVAGLGFKNIVELGTGTGLASAIMMEVLLPDAKLTTINWPNPPSGDDVGSQLRRYRDDPRLIQILGDTREVSAQVGNGIDLLFIDSGTTHNYDLIAREWELYSPKLAVNAMICIDDLDFPGGGIRRFWTALSFEKVETKMSPYGFGIVRV